MAAFAKTADQGNNRRSKNRHDKNVYKQSLVKTPEHEE